MKRFVGPAPAAVTPSAGGSGLGTTAERGRRQAAPVQAQQVLGASRDAAQLHRLLFEKVPHPRFVCHAATLRILEANEAAVRQFGFRRDALVRMDFTGLCPRAGRPALQEYCRRAAAWRAFGSRGPAGVFHLRTVDGSTREVALDATPIPVGGQRLLLVLAQDVSRERHAGRLLRAHQAVTQALAESSTLAEACPVIFQALCETLPCDWGELWRVDPAATVLRCGHVWRPGLPAASPPTRATRALSLARGEGIVGAVWQRNEPLWITDVLSYPDLQKAVAVARYGLRSAFALPIRLNTEVLGVIALFSRRVQPPDKRLLRLLRDICSQIGQVMGRRRAERQLLGAIEREQQRIGQDLHDGLCQQLAGLAYLASDLQAKLAKRGLPETAAAARIDQLARELAGQARQVARGLNPVKVGTVGLMAALEELAVTIRYMFAITCRFEYPRRILVPDHETAVQLYRIAQEAVHNAITHGKATDIVVSLSRQAGGLALQVADNGNGLGQGAPNRGGMGLENMHYRARSIGARLRLAPRPGGGTAVQCIVPARA